MDDPKPIEVLQALAPQLEEDILCALRFLYYVKARPVAPDAMYDAAEREFINRPETPEDSPLMNPGSDKATDYSERARALAFYLSILGWESGQRAGAPPGMLL
jgi:NAD-dependent DNA ligase